MSDAEAGTVLPHMHVALVHSLALYSRNYPCVLVVRATHEGFSHRQAGLGCLPPFLFVESLQLFWVRTSF